MFEAKKTFQLFIIFCYPAIIFLGLLLLLSDAILVMLATIFFFLFVNHLVFKTSNRNFLRNTVERVVGFSAITILFSYAFATFDNLILISLSLMKTGLLFGILTALMMTNHIARHCDDKTETKRYFFDWEMGTAENWINARQMLGWLIITVVLSLTIFGTIGVALYEDFDQYNGLSTFILFILLTFVLLSSINKGSKFIFDVRAKRLFLGSFLTLVGVFFTLKFEGLIGLACMLPILVGVGIIQSTLTKGNDLLDNIKEFRYTFLMPSIAFCCLGLSVWWSGLNSLSDYLIPNYQKDAIAAIGERRENVEKRVISLFSTLVVLGKLKEGYVPKVTLSLKPDRDWMLKSRLNMEAEFSYDYKNGHLDTLTNYKLGRYTLENSNIGQAIVNGFQLAIDNYLVNYFERGNEVNIAVEGTADATPFLPTSNRKYEGEYGNMEKIEVCNNFDRKSRLFSIEEGEKLNNENLAILRGFGIIDFIDSNIPKLKKGQVDYRLEYFADSQNIGGQHRRISIKMKIININSKLIR